MLIQHKNGKWSWNEGELCDSKEEALDSVKEIGVNDSDNSIFIVDAFETMIVTTLKDND